MELADLETYRRRTSTVVAESSDKLAVIRNGDRDVDLSVIERAIQKKSFRRFSNGGFQSKSFE